MVTANFRMMEHTVPPVTLSVGSRFENIELVQYVCDYLLWPRQVSPETAHAVTMALREGMANAIKHGNGGDPGKRVTVSLELDADRVRMRITDEGRGFDPSAVPDPLAPENRLKTSGSGIFYMRSFMDDVRYDFSPEGTQVVLEKRIPAGVSDPGGAEKRGGKKNMKATVRDSGNVSIIDLKGKITIGSGDIQLRDTITSLIDRGRHKILCDMKEVTVIDSSGIGELVGCFTTVKNKGGSLKLLHLPPKIQDVLTVTQLITVFDVFEDEQEAVASFGA